MSNSKPLPMIEDHIGEELQCQDAWHEDVAQLREMVVRQQTALAVVCRALFEHLPNQDHNVLDLSELLQREIPWNQ